MQSPAIAQMLFSDRHADFDCVILLLPTAAADLNNCVISPFHSFTLVFGKPTAQAGENAFVMFNIFALSFAHDINSQISAAPQPPMMC